MLRTRGIRRTTRALSHPVHHPQRVYSTLGQTQPSLRQDGSAAPSSKYTPTAPETQATSPAPVQPRSALSSAPLSDLKALQSRLRDWSILATSSLRRHTDGLSEKATTTFSNLGQHLNRVTGYHEIEVLKKRVAEQEARIRVARRAAREAKAAYDEAVLQRSISQRQVNDLLQRKSSWTDDDVSHFTSLVRSDHSFEQEEARAKARVAEMEDAADREFSEMMRVILARYHEEQVWSDKIRSASTYGSLAVLGVNVVVFIMAIIVVEPWKRKKLAQTFEKKVEVLGAETKVAMNANATRLEERLTAHEKLLTGLVSQVSAEAREGFSVAEAAINKVSPKQTSVPPASLWWSQAYPHLGSVSGRELILVVGSAAAGGVITLLARSLFAS